MLQRSYRTALKPQFRRATFGHRNYTVEINESDFPSPRSLHPFLTIHDSGKFAADFLTEEVSDGHRDFEDREKYRISKAVEARDKIKVAKVADMASRRAVIENTKSVFADSTEDHMIRLYNRAKKASLSELREICGSIESNAVLGDRYSSLPNYKGVRKGSALSAVAQEIIFRYQRLTVENETKDTALETEPLFNLVAYVFSMATEDVNYTAEAGDALFWAVCKSGTLEDITTVATMLAGMNCRPSDETVSFALSPALMPVTKMKDIDEKIATVIALYPLRPVFTQGLTPALASTMFGLCSRMDEFVSAFNLMKRCPEKHKMVAGASTAMVKSVVRCTKNEVDAENDIFYKYDVRRPHHQAMANMFAVARYLRTIPNSNFPQRAVERMLYECARSGNIAGLNKVMGWSKEDISQLATERLLREFPFVQGMAEEALIPSINVSSMLQDVSYEGQVHFMESLKKATAAKELVANIEEKLQSIN